MIPIRAAQLTALSEDAHRILIEKYIRLLREKYPSQLGAAPHSELRSFCESGIESARSHGLRTEFNIFVFLSAIQALGPQFDSDERTNWSQEILFDQNMDEDHKAGLLRLRILIDTGVDVAPHD